MFCVATDGDGIFSAYADLAHRFLQNILEPVYLLLQRGCLGLLVLEHGDECFYVG
jgi:hypothetical protein